MNEQGEQRQKLYKNVNACVQQLRKVFSDVQPPASQLPVALDVLADFEQNTGGLSVESFGQIINRLKVLLLGHLASQTQLTQLENEMVELAVDWLKELATLYKEGLPEPKSLVSELIYTFDLVERSHGAETLAELMMSSSGESKKAGDIFSDDPELVVDESSAPEMADPFEDDPGFGLEFDLLQRTLNRLPAIQSTVDDPFAGDPGLSVSEKNTGEGQEASVQSPFDVFEDDPPPVDGP